MKRMGLAVLVAFAAAGAARAEQKPATPNAAASIIPAREALCLYDNIPDADAVKLVGYAVFGEDASASAANAALDAAHVKCAKLGWNDDQKYAAEDVAIGAFLSDMSAGNLKTLGFNDLPKIHAIIAGLSRADHDVIVDGTYDENPAVRQRIEEKIKAAGVPEKDGGRRVAMTFIEAIVLTEDSLAAFAEAGGAVKN